MWSRDRHRRCQNDLETPATPPGRASAASAACFLHLCEDGDLPPSPEPPSGQEPHRHDAARSRTEMFSFPLRNVQRIHEHFGLDAVARLCKNLSRLSVMSLYSGLGGAEIAVSLTTSAARAYVQTNQLEEQVGYPAKPKNVLACDFNQDCQRILRAHTDFRSRTYSLICF